MSGRSSRDGFRQRSRIWSFATQYTIGFFIVYLALLLACPLLFYRDPTSRFFKPARSYGLLYSAEREAESDAFIQQAPNTPQVKVASSGAADICLGITTVARPEEHYFRNAVGSLLSGLSEHERKRLHLILFIAHTDPNNHPAYAAGWPSIVADRVLTYDGVPEAVSHHLKELEVKGGSFGEKTIFDYTYLLDACQETGAEHVAILEDDVIALDGWFYRTIRGLRAAQEKTVAKRADNYLYLRLFFTEKFLGWNSEEWPLYLFSSIGATLFVLISALTAGRLYSLGLAPTHRKSIDRSIIYHIAVFMPFIIGLAIIAGRASLFPLRNGVVEMPRFGCCSQGLVFPRDRVPEVVTYLKSTVDEPVDSAIETFANSRGEIRWALVPSVLQHVGAKSSKAGREGTRSIFNFDFEKNDAKRLKKEHLLRLKEFVAPRK